MSPFFNRSKQQNSTGVGVDPEIPSPARPMKFSQIVQGMGDFRDLSTHDSALKFWLPEPALEALRELCAINGDSLSETLRQFFAHHCYGIYAFQLMNKKLPGLFKDLDDSDVCFSRTRASDDPPGKKRAYTYWVPELGKNVKPIKVWVPLRLRNDLQLLADHVELNLSQYTREIVIARILGHGTLPYRPEMLAAAPLSAAQDWCDGEDVPLRQIGEEERDKHDEVRTVSEWVDA